MDLFSVIGSLIKSPGDMLGVHCIDKCIRIDLPYFFSDRLDLVLTHNRVQHIAFLLFITAYSFKESGVVVGLLADLFVDIIRFGSDDKQRLFLVALVQKVQHLSGSVLEYNGIKRFIPVEQISCNRQNDTVPYKNIIPCLNTEFLRKENGDKIGAAAGGVSVEAQRDCAGV